MHPLTPIDAVTHPDPYPYYASLLAGPPLYRDEPLQLWVAAHAASVAEVLAHPACRVRPPAEPVLRDLLGLPAGDVFSRLIRMTDGESQRVGKRTLERALATVPADCVAAVTRRIAARSMPVEGNLDALNDWIFATPIAVVAALLGLADDVITELPNLVRQFVACLTPSSTPPQRAAASAAAITLQAELAPLLDAVDGEALLADVRREAVIAAWTDRPALLANLVGLLSQTHDATAGLLGNCIVALALHEGLLHRVRTHPHGWTHLVTETLRCDPPVQNTRRFLAHRATIAGIALPAGAAILLVLAAANRDPAINAHPDRFDLDRPDRRLFTFGRGAHACPGQAIAATIVETALRCLFAAHGEAYLRSLAWRHRPSVNGRLPHFIPAP